MSSREPNPDDEDTGPLHVGRVDAPQAGPPEPRYNAPMSVNPRIVQRDRRPVVPVAAVAVGVIALGALAWAFWPSSGDGDGSVTATTTTAEGESQQEAESRLLGMVPKGYAEGACEVVVPVKGAVAQVSCEKNDDNGGPLTATYSLARDGDSLTELFDEVLGTTSVVNCPGNIQSPGPWRRNATPDQAAGTLMCGFQQTKPTVAWTTDADLLMSEVQSGPQGPNMVQLYTWWASHS
ncbi:hypothetical protein [Mycobacterium sp. 236(2023)]|uniref:hypothetical protein n=1 Tax=Mycobacterium sp. 236(2023) TaxID=3038163 RepID=UPI0024150FCB|nr:hypothetical protein [Mycobacterium sp. 236(2023)]MDG4665399.1 hypothetical protein [Mycobacterium sp. 236(2023)]